MASTPLTSKEMLLLAAEMFNESFGEARTSRWLVDLNDPPRVIRAHSRSSIPDEYCAADKAYFVRAQDELEAFMKARKMEENK